MPLIKILHIPIEYVVLIKLGASEWSVPCCMTTLLEKPDLSRNAEEGKNTFNGKRLNLQIDTNCRLMVVAPIELGNVNFL